jgi:hypothetical protein
MQFSSAREQGVVDFRIYQQVPPDVNEGRCTVVQNIEREIS